MDIEHGEPQYHINGAMTDSVSEDRELSPCFRRTSADDCKVLSQLAASTVLRWFFFLSGKTLSSYTVVMAQSHFIPSPVDLVNSS